MIGDKCKNSRARASGTGSGPLERGDELFELRLGEEIG
eukprot:CAMPEP_0184671248 /NCGR_PEP_ID=MMETSP0308-20130426/85383_1 /TAXON_ID=38269 /ORGANISM="Gloeochaete witrockiana, Strain SAG 46.84" /LENGTH=37 /DNA_ID=CAMNT_0027118333 /DNA_START=1637 /DNA_END=1746 /DNA_ORIENTATION=+